VRRLRAVVFDLDDTLYPERAYVLSGFRAVSIWAERTMHVPAERCRAQLRRLFDGGIRGGTFDAWLEHHGFAVSDLVPEMVRVYREHQPEIAPFPGGRLLLERLAGRHRLGLVSDGFASVQQRKLTALKLTEHFDAVVLTEELGPGLSKPSAIPFHAVLKRLGVSAEDAVYVADNPTKDFIGARIVGMATVRMRSRAGLYRELEPPSPEHAAEIEIDDLRSLTMALYRLERSTGELERAPI
jgi:putative hydrolase of the HAD superfamily